jgi:hypothetical protein
MPMEGLLWSGKKERKAFSQRKDREDCTVVVTDLGCIWIAWPSGRHPGGNRDRRTSRKGDAWVKKPLSPVPQGLLRRRRREDQTSGNWRTGGCGNGE